MCVLLLLCISLQRTMPVGCNVFMFFFRSQISYRKIRTHTNCTERKRTREWARDEVQKCLEPFQLNKFILIISLIKWINHILIEINQGKCIRMYQRSMRMNSRHIKTSPSVLMFVNMCSSRLGTAITMNRISSSQKERERERVGERGIEWRKNETFSITRKDQWPKHHRHIPSQYVPSAIHTFAR